MAYERMYKKEEVKDFLLDEMNIVLEEERFTQLYNMITNPEKRVNDNDKQWVAYETQDSENDTVVDAIKEIINVSITRWYILYDDKVKKTITKVGNKMLELKITYKPRIPFYILVLDEIVN